MPGCTPEKINLNITHRYIIYYNEYNYYIGTSALIRMLAMLNPRLIIKKRTIHHGVQIGGKKVAQGSYLYFIYICDVPIHRLRVSILLSSLDSSTVYLLTFTEDSTILIELRLNTKSYYVPSYML